MPLENQEDQLHLSAAEGFLQLGMPLDANEELEHIDAYVRHVPDALLDEAKARLKVAFNLDSTLRLHALYDDDLEALWNDLGSSWAAN